jgi:phosphoenolpyruvate phosphomutase
MKATIHKIRESKITLTKAQLLKSELQSKKLSFLMEAHNGISAKIVEQAGFKGIWASGLSISAALGVRDNNEASWTQILEVLEFMSDATNIPILVDGDTGHGNFNNMRRFVKKLCQRNIAGVCIEDKIFPKTNSFIEKHQPLAAIEEFCGKIKAGKDSQTDDSFSIIARVEALIAGWSLDEALRRAEAYHKAGADGILIHSRQNKPDEVLDFKKEWGNRCPVIIVPTKYFKTPVKVFQESGFSTVIWANQNLRSSITAMRKSSELIRKRQSVADIEEKITSMDEVFELTENQELRKAEEKYLRKSENRYRSIIIAASRGKKLSNLTKDKPKCMLDIRGKPLLRRLVSTMNKNGINDVSVVRGYKKEKINFPSLEYFDNDKFESTGEASSLFCAKNKLKDNCIVSYGDILFRRYILDALMAARGDIVLAVDALGEERDYVKFDRKVDLVQCSRKFTGNYLLEKEEVTLKKIKNKLPAKAVHGEWMGLIKTNKSGSKVLLNQLKKMKATKKMEKSNLLDLLNNIIKSGHKISVIYLAGNWLDVDDAYDLAEARNFTP